MKNYIDIPTHKHTSRFALNLFWFSICVFVTGLAIYGMIMKFKWEMLLVFGAAIFGLVYYGDAVWAYINFQKITLRVEAKEDLVIFSGLDEKGEKVYDDQSFDMKKVARAYYLVIRAKMLKFKTIEFQLNNSVSSTEEMYLIPDSHDMTEEDVYEILHFLKENFPHIKLGTGH